MRNIIQLPNLQSHIYTYKFGFSNKQIENKHAYFFNDKAELPYGGLAPGFTLIFYY